MAYASACFALYLCIGDGAYRASAGVSMSELNYPQSTLWMCTSKSG